LQLGPALWPQMKQVTTAFAYLFSSTISDQRWAER